VITLAVLTLALLAGLALEELWLIPPVFAPAGSDRLARRLLLAAKVVPLAGVLACLATMPWHGGFRATGFVNVVGFVLCVTGIALRSWARLTLGRLFAAGIVADSGQRVVRDGPYLFVRHPGCLGLILFYTGLPLVAGNLWGLAFLSLPLALVHAALLLVEERRMAAGIGAAYLDYQRRSWRLIPGVW
jgi:protein-S-isoprenylcysteine O-methyltransferase Ste14